jgi:hypothetical protein
MSTRRNVKFFDLSMVQSVYHLIVNLVDVVMADEAELPPLSILVKISVS